MSIQAIADKITAAQAPLRDLRNHLTAPKGINLCESVEVALVEALEVIGQLQRESRHEHDWVNVSAPGDISKLERCQCGSERHTDAAASESAEGGA